LIFLDIETLNLPMKELVKYKRYLPQIDKINDLLAKEIPDPEKLRDITEDMIKTASLDPLLGRVLCIGICHSRDKKTVVEKCFYDASSEKVLLESFWGYIDKEQLTCETVTFNGITFDLPWIYFRSFVHQVQIPWADLGLKRFGTWPHFDVMQSLAFWQSYKGKGQGYIAMALGCTEENQKEALNGSHVHKLYAAGEHQKIQDYCMSDVRQLIEIYKKIYRYFPKPPRSRAISQGAY
jgi:uncharacterized protein YprB with RNaseH-like and TPR domain